jgi:hypothetical protein
MKVYAACLNCGQFIQAGKAVYDTVLYNSGYLLLCVSSVFSLSLHILTVFLSAYNRSLCHVLGLNYTHTYLDSSAITALALSFITERKSVI